MNKKKKPASGLYIALAFGLLILTAGLLIIAKKYAPTRERMELSEVYESHFENEAAVILNGEYMPTEETDSCAYGVILSGTPYLQLDFIKNNIDNRYVYDDSEKVLRYTTDTDIISVNIGDNTYSVGRTEESIDAPIIEQEGAGVYLAVQFVQKYSDLGYSVESDPDRIIIQLAGWEKKTATIKKNTQIRRLGGPKSKILKDVSKGDHVIVLDEIGKWTEIMTDDGVMGYCLDKYIIDKNTETVEAVLPERSYKHILMNEKVSMGWVQIMDKPGNVSIDSVLNKAGDGINVISPTWFRLSDNQGGIDNIASYDYVNKCHDMGIQVWGLVNNFDNKDISSNAVLTSASARDNLINNLIGAAVAYDMDGINVDFEFLQPADADGFLEFIRELSVKCRNNDLVLSVDNYVPSSFHAFYDYEEQGKYADYVVIMAYDEHYSGSDDPGSVSSLGFVEKAASDMLEYVSPDQIILGMPFYYRLWITNETGLTSSVIHMDETDSMLEKYGATTNWIDEVGQSYAEFDYEGSHYQTWIEDTRSLELKLQVMEENNLAGAAFWKLGLEPESTWDVINEYLQ
ncbi:MAG: glycosyl hydrolase family 18 [Lachnospiraceae bacterium]|nr:glycosyl hydrolase family 18 [Lachnospiraceae bacterium]